MMLHAAIRFAQPSDALGLAKLRYALRSSTGKLNEAEPDFVKRCTAWMEARLIDDLLDVSRVESGKMTYRFEPVNLATLVQEVVDRCAEQLHAAHCTLDVRVDDEVSVTCDRFRIEQVVTNLMTNAMKYGAGTAVEVLLAAAPNGAMIRVTDQGLGIAQDKHAKSVPLCRALAHLYEKRRDLVQAVAMWEAVRELAPNSRTARHEETCKRQSATLRSRA